MKNRNLMNKAYEEIENFRSKLGETFFDALMEEDNYTYEMAKGIIGVFDSCETEREEQIADRMLIAICGYSLETLISTIKTRDENGYMWKSC